MDRHNHRSQVQSAYRKHLTQAAWSLDAGIRYSMTFVYDVPFPRNLREYPHIRYIFKNYNHRPNLCHWQYRSVFVEIFVVGSVKLSYFCKSGVSDVQGHPRSLILLPIESAYATSLVRNSNLGPVLHRFGDIARVLCSWPNPYSTLILGVFPFDQIAHVGVNMSRDLSY